MDCLFHVKTITLETANVTNCHVIATDILFLSSNHRLVQFLYLAASAWKDDEFLLSFKFPAYKYQEKVSMNFFNGAFGHQEP